MFYLNLYSVHLFSCKIIILIISHQVKWASLSDTTFTLWFWVLLGPNLKPGWMAQTGAIWKHENKAFVFWVISVLQCGGTRGGRELCQEKAIAIIQVKNNETLRWDPGIEYEKKGANTGHQESLCRSLSCLDFSRINRLNHMTAKILPSPKILWFLSAYLYFTLCLLPYLV